MALPERSATRRLFFALWPDTELRGRLASLGRDLAGRAGRPTRVDNLHATLAFLGEVETPRLDCIRQAAAAVMAPAFALSLDQTGCQRRSGLIWCGASVVPEGLQSLVGGLNSHLFRCGFQPEPRPFWAHVTLARKARPVPRAPLAWRVGEFVLVESILDRSGASYLILDRWPLTSM